MTPYKTNSAQYLDYVASVRTREQIAADPKLCVFLNNPYIKDNMEIALLYNAAKTGDYADKMSFVEYFMCNGPELDTDSLMHYRTKIAIDPVCNEIAYSYYSDPDILSDLRANKYGKKDDDDGNCFTKPCFYMGRFSSAVGKHATLENAMSMWNSFADAFTPTASEKKEKTQTLTGTALAPKPKYPVSFLSEGISAASTAATDMVSGLMGGGVDGAVKPSSDGNPDPAPIPTEKHLWGWIPTSIKNSIGAFESLFSNNFKDFCVKLQDAGNLDTTVYGDPMAIAFTKKKEILVNSNIKRQMADCARMWDHARRFEVYNPAQNATGPISFSQIIGNKYTNGMNMNAEYSVSLKDAQVPPAPVVNPTKK